jgi:hypothetical protein
MAGTTRNCPDWLALVQGVTPLLGKHVLLQATGRFTGNGVSKQAQFHQVWQGFFDIARHGFVSYGTYAGDLRYRNGCSSRVSKERRTGPVGTTYW